MKIAHIRKKIGATTIHTKKSLFGARAGQFKTRAHGSGYDFDQLREYQQGDDVRFIDWKSSARTGKMLLRTYHDERCRDMHILLDSSRSLFYGTGPRLVWDVAREIAAAFALMGANTDDAIGLHFIDRAIKKSLSARASRRQVARVCAELGAATASVNTTSLADALRSFTRFYTKKSLVVIISDFIDDGSYERELRIVSRWHEVLLVRIRDRAGQAYARAGLPAICDVSDAEHALAVECGCLKEAGGTFASWESRQADLFRRLQLPVCDCSTEGDHLDRLVAFVRHSFA